MAIEQIRPLLGGAFLHLYYVQRDLSSFVELWEKQYNATNVQGKLNMLREVLIKYPLFSRAIADLI